MGQNLFSGEIPLRCCALLRRVFCGSRLCKLAIGFAYLLGMSTTMLAASDTVLRAAYCMRVLDGMITAEQRDGARTQQQVLEAYRLLAQQRPLNETEQKSYAFAQVMHSEFLRRMENTRSRLAGYLATNGLLKGFLADDGALDDFPGIALALNRGQADHSRCEVEKTPAVFCIAACAHRCTTNPNCIRECVGSCGAAACARSMPCVNPDFLPY